MSPQEPRVFGSATRTEMEALLPWIVASPDGKLNFDFFGPEHLPIVADIFGLFRFDTNIAKCSFAGKDFVGPLRDADEMSR